MIGLVSKHGILIVEIANEEQHSGKSNAAAIAPAAAVRLRPILMTTAAMVRRVLPLVFASGAGAASRFFTLFVVPDVYMLIGANHSATIGPKSMG